MVDKLRENLMKSEFEDQALKKIKNVKEKESSFLNVPVFIVLYLLFCFFIQSLISSSNNNQLNDLIKNSNLTDLNFTNQRNMTDKAFKNQHITLLDFLQNILKITLEFLHSPKIFYLLVGILIYSIVKSYLIYDEEVKVKKTIKKIKLQLEEIIRNHNLKINEKRQQQEQQQLIKQKFGFNKKEKYEDE